MRIKKTGMGNKECEGKDMFRNVEKRRGGKGENKKMNVEKKEGMEE